MQVGTNVNVSQDRHPRTYQFTDNLNWTKGEPPPTLRRQLGTQQQPWDLESASHWGVLGLQPHGGWPPESPIYQALPASLKIGYTGPRATFAELLQLPMNGHVEHRRR